MSPADDGAPPSRAGNQESEPIKLLEAPGEPMDFVGFQQVSELKPIAGIDVVGPLPQDVQRVTVFAAGIASASAHRDAARKVIAFLASESGAAAITKSGLERAVR
jgi:molybdate transport system substrate-binding protein